MDSPDSLVPEAQVDRTPYGACAGVAAVVLALFLLAAAGLWQAAGWTKRHGLTLNLDAPALPAVSGGSVTDAANQALQQAKQAAGDQVQQAANQAARSAADAAQQEAQQQASQAGDAVRSQIQNALR